MTEWGGEELFLQLTKTLRDYKLVQTLEPKLLNVEATLEKERREDTMANALLVAVPENLAELPLDLAEVQVGWGLHADTPLETEQREAVDAFFALIDPYWKEPAEREALTPEKWWEILLSYQHLLDLRMGRYCVIIRIGAAFGLDDDALSIVAVAEAGGVGCYGCHGMF